MANHSVEIGCEDCPPGAPVAVRNVATGELMGCFASVGDAARARSLYESDDVGLSDDGPIDIGDLYDPDEDDDSDAGDYCGLCSGDHDEDDCPDDGDDDVIPDGASSVRGLYRRGLTPALLLLRQMLTVFDLDEADRDRVQQLIEEMQCGARRAEPAQAEALDICEKYLQARQ